MKTQTLFRMMLSLVVFALVLAPAALAQDPPAAPPEPNEGTHIQFSGSYGTASVTGLSIPVSNRFSILLVNAFNSNDSDATRAGLSFHTVELEYARKLSDLLKAKSNQFNSDRFHFAVSAGAGSVRNAQGKGNASFAFSFGGRVTIRLNDNVALDVVNVRYWRSRIATLSGQENAGTQAGAGFRFSF